MNIILRVVYLFKNQVWVISPCWILVKMTLINWRWKIIHQIFWWKVSSHLILYAKNKFLLKIIHMHTSRHLISFASQVFNSYTNRKVGLRRLCIRVQNKLGQCILCNFKFTYFANKNLFLSLSIKKIEKKTIYGDSEIAVSQPNNYSNAGRHVCFHFAIEFHKPLNDKINNAGNPTWIGFVNTRSK